MKLNNKGFAITSVLYGLLLLFVFLVSSYLLVLTSKKNRLDTISADIDDKYGFNTKIVVSNPFSSSDSYTASYTGKYVFNMDAGGTDYTCSSYLKKGTNITLNGTYGSYFGFNNIVFTDSRCIGINDDWNWSNVNSIEIWYNNLGSDS